MSHGLCGVTGTIAFNTGVCQRLCIPLAGRLETFMYTGPETTLVAFVRLVSIFLKPMKGMNLDKGNVVGGGGVLGRGIGAGWLS